VTKEVIESALTREEVAELVTKEVIESAITREEVAELATRRGCYFAFLSWLLSQSSPS